MAFQKRLLVTATLIAVAMVPVGGANDFSEMVSVVNFEFVDDWSGTMVSNAGAGDSITFSFDEGTHSATAVAGTESFDSGIISHDPDPDADNTFTITLAGPGLTEYRCVIHPSMHGVLVVA